MARFYDDEDEDALGISLGERARQHRQRFQQREVEDYEGVRRQNPYVGLYGPLRSSIGGQSSGPLKDWRWDAFFQALDEAGVDNLAGQSVGVKRGMFRPSLAMLMGGGH